jgi:putative salt-induced outer membrane protein YdiY
VLSLLLTLVGSGLAATEDIVFSETEKELEEAPHPVTMLAAEVGANSGYGNAVSSIVYTNVDAAYRWGWKKLTVDNNVEVGRAVVDADGDGTISDEEREVGYQSTSEEFSIDLRYDRYLNSRGALYGLGGWLRDPFSGYEIRVHGQAGYSRVVMDDEAQSLVAELGADVAREVYTEGVDPRRAWHYSARVDLEWSAQITDDLVFEETMEAFVNVENPRDIRVLSEMSLTLTATDILSVKTTYQVTHDTVPVDGYRTTDQTIALTLVAGMLRSRVPPTSDPELEFGNDPS